MDSHRPHILYESNRHIVNFHTNIKFTPARYCDVWNFWDDNTAPQAKRWRPGMLAIQQIIRDAQSRNMPVRALGAAWSLSNAAVTRGCLLNTKPLNVIETGMRRNIASRRF